MSAADTLDCGAARRLACAFCDGTIAQSDRSRYSLHLLRCNRCRLLVDDLRLALATLAELADPGDHSPPPWLGHMYRLWRAASTPAAPSAGQKTASTALTSFLPSPRGGKGSRDQADYSSLVKAALDESFDSGPRNPALALSVAEVAVAVAEMAVNMPHSGVASRDLVAAAQATLGNARRINNQIRAAEAAFTSALASWELGSRRGELRAHILALRSTLRCDQRQFDDGRLMLEEALAIFRRSRDNTNVGRTLIRLGTILGEAGHTDDAIRALSDGCRLLDPASHEALLLGAKHNMALYFLHAARVEEAAGILTEIRPAYQRIGRPMYSLRLRWLEGLLAKERGNLAEAEGALREVRERFRELNLPYDVALASLDLATVYLLQGRTTEIAALSVEMMTVFRSLAIEREAMAAVLVLYRAARLERVTEFLLARLAESFKRFRTDSQ